MQNATVSRYERVRAQDGDIGAVQRRDRARHMFPAAARAAGENLPRQIRGRGVRNRVMRVDDVELMRARHLHHAIGQRQQILRLAKQRIAGRLDAVEP